MAARRKTINLLPVQLVASSTTLRRAKLLSTIAMGLGGLVVLMGVVGGGALYYFNSQRTMLREDIARLRQVILSLEGTEQGLILARDRVEKINRVLADRSTEGNFENQADVYSQFQREMSLADLRVDSSGAVMTVDITNSAGISDFLNLILSETSVEGLLVEDLSFTPVSGFRYVLSIL